MSMFPGLIINPLPVPFKYQTLCNLCYLFAFCAVQRRMPPYGRPRTYRRLLRNSLGVMPYHSRKVRANTSRRGMPDRAATSFRGKARLAESNSPATCIRILRTIRLGLDLVSTRNKRENPERERPAWLAISATLREQQVKGQSRKSTRLNSSHLGISY